MEKVAWKVEGMTCANCALNINKTLEKQGMQNVAVNAMTGDVSFETVEANDNNLLKIKKRVEDLGYKVNPGGSLNGKSQHEGHGHEHHHHHDHASTKGAGISKYMLRFWISLPFTLILMLHMIPGIHWLMNPWLQFGLALPVYLIGMEYFGKSAYRSLRGGIPNMDVLVTLGATAAFGYSCYGLFTNKPQDFLFFETAASIITIVLFGNWLEHVSVSKTQAEIKKLSQQQIVMANMIAYDEDHNENIFPVENTQLRVGDLILIKTGEQVPMDCKILWGEAEVSEAIITGESVPVLKKKNDTLVGGSVMVNGTIKAYVSAVGKDTVMNSIVEMMNRAQTEKPPVQKLADKISAIFVPAVLLIAGITLLLNIFLGGHDFRESLLRSVAVLVIACPCAMGLATPAAIAVGLGRAAKKGILFTDVSRMELFRNVTQVVFDKTGTLSTGQFTIAGYSAFEMDDAEFKRIVFSLEKFSTHPIAKSIAASWKTKNPIVWKKLDEIKGLGMRATDKNGDEYAIGSEKIHASAAGSKEKHQLYVVKNDQLIGWLNIADELRPEAKDIVRFCKSKNIKTLLLSGDSYAKTQAVANELGIDEVIAEQTPAQKLAKMEELSREQTTVMVGDGINDAPALAKATISVSLSEASQLAIQSASVVLTNNGLKHFPTAMMLGKQTYNTVKSNLFWAFAYNIVAIPVAAMGYLHPSISALIMGGSDVVLALNSLWLGVKKLK